VIVAAAASQDRVLCAFGSHRVIEPSGLLPQPAWRLDNTPVCYANEIRCDVDVLNLDSASFRQICEAEGRDPQRIAEHVMRTVAERGKQHNPTTGSGGMFVGRIAEIGAELETRARPGDRIASLVSLSLTPLHLDEIKRVDLETGRLWVRGTAILFAGGTFANLPEDLHEEVALAVLDVAGAPAQVARLAKPGMSVVVIGCDGKSGLLSSLAAAESVGPHGRVIGISPSGDSPGSRLLLENHWAQKIIAADARDVLETWRAVERELPDGADLVVNCVNCSGTELATILCARELGTVYFFSMCTSFTAAALGAEGIGKDVTMIVGNGYTRGHATLALDLLRNHAPLLEYFIERYG